MPNPYVIIDNKIISTQIDVLGKPCEVTNIPGKTLPNDALVPIYIGEEQLDELQGKEPVATFFEPAGGRQQLFFKPSSPTCAIVTCGGLCPGINDVIRSIVMEAWHNYGITNILGYRYGLEGFIAKYGHKIEKLTPSFVDNIHQFGGTVLGSSRGPQNTKDIVDTLLKDNVSILFMIGGDGTMRAMEAIVKEIKARKLQISIIGIPKTIDNDINFITKSFGFESAVFKATESIACAHTEALGYKNGIGIVKLMGRNSGFIAAHASLALKQVNFVLIPEYPFALHGKDGFLEALAKRLLNRHHAVIVIAEGAGQHLIENKKEYDLSGNVIFTDVHDFFVPAIKSYMQNNKINCHIKYIDPSYIIRSIPANPSDKIYCGFLGQNAVHAAMAGRTNMVVAKVTERYVHLPLPIVTMRKRTLNTSSAYWQTVIETTGQPFIAKA